MKLKRQIAFVTLLIMVLNIFCPYMSLFNNTVQAATGQLEESPLIFNNLGITTKGSNKVLTVELAFVSEETLNGFDLQFKVDTSVLKPCNKNTGAANNIITLITTQNTDYYQGTLQTKTYDASTGTFHFTATEPAGGFNAADNGFIPGQLGDPAIDENGAGYPAYYPVLKMFFQVQDTSLEADDIDLSVFELVPNGVGLPTGLKVNYLNASGVRVSEDIQIAGNGFKESGKTVSSIAIKNSPTNTTYEHGDTIDLTGGEITVTYDDGTSEDIDMTASGVNITSPFSGTADVSNPTVTISYSGKTANFPITVTDPIDSLVVTSPMTDIEYEQDENFDFTGLELTATKRSGATVIINSESTGLTISENVADIDSANFTQTSASGVIPISGTQKITFTYEGKETYQTVVVNDTIDSINVINQPTKKVYKYGENLDLSGAVIEVTLVSGNSTNINLPDGSVTVSSYSSSTTGAKQNLPVSFGGVTAPQTIDVEVYDYIISSRLTNPTKDVYIYNDPLSLTGGNLILGWASGSPTTVTLTADMVSGFSSTIIGSQELTVTYNAQYTLSDGTVIPDVITKTFYIEMTNPAKSIVMTAPTKDEYNHGENLDLSDGVITVTYEDNTTQNVTMTTAMITESDGSAVNMSPAASDYTNYELNKTLTIEYTEDTVTQSVSYPITIKNNVEEISMDSNPTDTSYCLNDTTYSLAGGSILVERAAGDTQTVLLTDTGVTLTPLSDLTTTIGTKQVTVTYEGKTTTFNIEVDNYVTAVTITPPTEDTYNHGATLDLAGGEITLTYADGTTSTEDISLATITESDGTTTPNMSPAVSEFVTDNKMTKTLLIKYTTANNVTGSVNYPITIINDVKSIAMHGTAHKVTYNVSESLDTSVGEILVTRAVGNSEVIGLNDSRVAITGFDSSLEKQSLPLTVTFTENGNSATTTYTVSVVDTVTSVDVQNAPTVSKYGEELDLTGVTIDVVRGSGPDNIQVTSEMLSGFDKNTVSSQTVTVSYGGQTDTFTVEVKDYVKEIIVNPNSVTGEYRDTLADLISANNIKYTVDYAKGPDLVDVALDINMVDVSSYDDESTTLQSLTVTYTDTDTDSFTNGQSFTDQLEITLENVITGVSITAPTKDTYNHGATLDLTGGVITITYADNTTSTENISLATITESDGTTTPNMSPAASEFVTDNKMAKTLLIKYTTANNVIGSVNYPITIINDVRSIAMHGTAHQVLYNVGEGLNTAVGEILVTRAVGNSEVIGLNDSRVAITGFDSTTEYQSLPLTVTFTENGNSATTTYTVSVVDTVTDLDMLTLPKTTYKYGETLDLTGGKVTVTRGSGTTDIDLSDCRVTETNGNAFDSSLLGTRRLAVTYGGYTTTYEITVKDYVKEIKINPNPVTGKYGDTLADLLTNNNAKYTVVYAKAGAQTPITLAGSMVAGYNATSTSAQSLTVTYRDNDANSYTNGTDITGTLNVTLIDNVNSISISGAPTEALYGEELDFTNSVITVTRDSGTGTINISDATISGYDKNTVGPQTVTLTYGGKSTSFAVEVKDYIEDIELTAPTNTQYNWSETGTLDITGGSVKAIMASGASTTPVELDHTDVTLSNFVPNQEGTQTITVTYKGFTKSFDVEVIDEIYGIVVNDAPSSVDYGKKVDLSNTTISVTKDSGTVTIPVTEDMLSNYDSTDLSGVQTITVTYEGQTDTFDISVNDFVVDFVLTAPSKTVYEHGEELDLSDAVITKITASGANTETVAVTANMISGYNNTKLGAQTVTVTYEGIEKTFGVVVEDNLQSIAMDTTPKTDYLYGEELSVTGGKILVTRSSGSEVMDITPSMVTGFDPNKVGPQTITVTYAGLTTSYDVNVKDYEEKITIDYPSKLIYKLNEELDLKDGKVNVIMASGAVKETINMTESMISGFDSSATGAKKLTVTYEGFTATFGITVVDELAEVMIYTLPDKLDYLYGEKMDLTGASIQVIRESGNKEIIPIDASMISGFDTKKLGVVTVKVTYQGFETEFPINVEDYEVGAKFIAPEKTTYEYGEELDLTGGLIKILMASGAVDNEIKLTASMVSEFKNKEIGKQTLTVKYEDYTYTYDVEVKDSIGGIALNSEPDKTQYNYGENIDVTGGTIKVIRTSGTTIEKITSDMISGYNPEVSGYQVIKVTYEGFETEFVVYVYAKPVAPSTEEDKPETQPETKPTVKPTRPTKPTTKPTKPSTSTTIDTPVVEEEVIVPDNTPVIEEVIKPEETPIIEDTKDEEKEEKPTIVLGVKDEKDNRKDIAKILLLVGWILLLILLISRKNTKIYVEENQEFVLGGKEKIKKKDPKIDVNEYLDGQTYNGKVKIVLNDNISEKLDGKVLTIKHREEMIAIKVEYRDEPYVIILE